MPLTSAAPTRLCGPLAALFDALPADWRAVTQSFATSLTCARLCAFVDERVAAGATVFPPRPLRALELTPFDAVRIVILGQDPYHGPGQAHGLAFSVPDGVRPPPSLRNIFLELSNDIGVLPPPSGDLSRWARQGVLLLNAVMTVEEGRAASHAGKGWEQFTDLIVERLARSAAPKVFLLWGACAQAKAPMIAAAGGAHRVLMANHPSPLSARRPPLPFLGCRHFSLSNAYLGEHGHRQVEW